MRTKTLKPTPRPMAIGTDAISAFVGGLSLPTIGRLEARGEFPRRRLLADRRVAWLVSEIEAWLESRPVSDLPPVPSAASDATEAAGERAAA